MKQYSLVFWWNFQSELASISNQIFPYMAKCSARTRNFLYQYCMYCGFFTVRCVFYSCCIYWKWSCQDNKKEILTVFTGANLTSKISCHLEQARESGWDGERPWERGCWRTVAQAQYVQAQPGSLSQVHQVGVHL